MVALVTPRQAAGESVSGQASGASAFTRTILSLLDRIEYRFCDSGEDLEAIYRLRYNAYLQAGMVRPDASRMVADSFDDLPNSFRFGVFF